MNRGRLGVWMSGRFGRRLGQSDWPPGCFGGGLLGVLPQYCHGCYFTTKKPPTIPGLQPPLSEHINHIHCRLNPTSLTRYAELKIFYGYTTWKLSTYKHQSSEFNASKTQWNFNAFTESFQNGASRRLALAEEPQVSSSGAELLAAEVTEINQLIEAIRKGWDHATSEIEVTVILDCGKESPALR